jgi:hypothetical protein
MKFPRPSLHMKRATGICVGENRLTVAVCAASTRGPKEIDSFEVPIGWGGPLEALRTLPQDPRIAGALAFGFDPRREFCATIRLTREETEMSVADLLAARLGRLEGGLVGAVTPLKLPGGAWASVTAVSKKSAGAALEAFAESSGSRMLLLPVAQELHRAAMRLTRGPRKWRTKIRILPSKTRGMAILSHGPHPLAWRLFPWSTTDPFGSIEAAVRLLANHAREELRVETIDGLLVHCGIKHDAFAAKCGELLKLPALAGEQVIVDEALIASVLAAGALAHKPGDLNLFDELLPKPGLRANFPYVSAAALSVVMFSTAGLLYSEASRTSKAAAHIEQRVRSDKLGIALKTKDLEAARDQMKSEVDHAKSFIVDRVQWGPLLKEVPNLLPPTLTLTGFDGRDALRGFGDDHQSKGARRAILMGEVSFDGDASSPPEVGMLTNRVEGSAVFTRVFPDVTGAKVRLKPGTSQDLAQIMVLCMPKGG